MSSHPIWQQYATVMPTFRPVFGNSEHIRLTDIIAEINRKEPQYLALKSKHEAKDGAQRGAEPKRMAQLFDELTRLKIRAINIMTA